MKFSYAIASTLCLGGGSVFGSEDSSAPLVSDFTFTENVEVESSFMASITVSDESGIDHVAFNAYPSSPGWWYPCQDSTFSLVNGTIYDGVWYLECFIPSDTPSQNYAISYSACDTENHCASESYRRGFKVTGGPPAESDPPLIEKVSYDQEVKAGTTFTASLVLSDESGIADGYINLHASEGNYIPCTAEHLILSSGSSTDGVFTASCDIPSSAPNGEYWLEIHVYDTQKNPAEDFTENTFTLYGGSEPDLTPPSIGTIAIEDTTLTAGQTLHVTAQIADPQTGVNHVSFYAVEPYSQAKFCQEDMTMTGGDAFSGTWEVSCVVPEGTMIAYYDASILAYDNQNNVGFKTAYFQVVFASLES